MKFQLINILILYIINITLCIAIRYDCDTGNITCGCGFKNVEINEEYNNLEEAIPYSWSMMVSIRYDCNGNNDSSSHCCAGIILNEQYILTTARCMQTADNASLLSENITIAASIHSLSPNCQTTRVVSDIFIHPNWTSTNEAMHNIAILRLAEPLDFKTDFILRSACFPFQMNNSSVEIMSNNNTLVVVGWSVLDHSGDNKNQVLQQLMVDLIDYNDSFCSRSVDDNKLLFCAGRYGAACFPEVGGAMFQWIGNRWELVGIESYAIDGCPRVGYKGLFVRVSAYYDWIESILNPDNMITTSTESITTELDMTTSIEPLLLNYECNRRLSCGCSYSDVSFRPTRIADGEDAVEHSWSMIVSLRFYGSKEHSCGGTLVSSSYVLTAAHCVALFSSTQSLNITIIAGITNRSDSDSYQRNVDRIYIHQNYTDRPYFLHDIALLHMDRPLYFQNNPVLAKTCVHRINSSISFNEHYPKNGTHLVVIGWGAMRAGSFLQSEYLQQIRITAIDNRDEICKKAISNDELQFCAGLYNGNKDACLGDSGGPILHWTGQYWEQVGIVGYNHNCGRPGYPGIYTRLSYYWQWMEDILNATNEHLEPHTSIPLSSTTTSTRSTTVRNTTRRLQTTASSNTVSSSIVTIPHASQTVTSSAELSSPAITISKSPQTMISSDALPSSTATNSDILQTMISFGGLSSSTATSSNMPRTMIYSDALPSSTATRSNIPQTMISSGGLSSSTVTSSKLPQTMMHSDTLPPSITTSSKLLQTIKYSDALPSSTATSSDTPRTMISSSGVSSSTASNSKLPQTMMHSDTLPPSTATSSNLPQTMMHSDALTSSTFTSSNMLRTMIYSDALPSSTAARSNIPQTMISSGGLSSPAVTISKSPQTMIYSDALPSSTATSSDKPRTMISSSELSSSTVASSKLPQTMTSSDLLPSSTATSSSTPQTMISSGELSLPTVMSSKLPQTMVYSDASTSSTATSSNIPRTMIYSDAVPSSTAAISKQPQTMISSDALPSSISASSNIPRTMISSDGFSSSTAMSSKLLQTMISSGTLTAMTTSSLSSHITTTTTTTVLPLRKITYECNRSLNECGCSLSNVVLTSNNQQLSSINGISESAYPYSWSMIVSIRVSGTKHICVGTILSDLFILTTAQCMVNHITSQNITIAAGIHSLSQQVTSSRTVAKVYIHENYSNNSAHLHDIAILRLEHPLELKIQPLFSETCLSNTKSPISIVDSSIVSIGWKHLIVDETTPDSLQQVLVKSIINPNPTCFNFIYNDIYQFCAGLIINNTDTCEEYFGEPIFVYRDKYWEQIGMLSKARGCINIGHSGVFTRLSAYTDWIQRIMQNTPIPIRRPVNTNTASKLTQNILILNILLFIIQIFY